MPTHVLLVEDSRAVRDFVSSILESAGDYIVHETENGFEALRALPRFEFGILVTDVNMPDVNGIEITRFVRQTPKFQHLGIIVISTDASHTDKLRALEAGADAFLAKPFTSDVFLEALERVSRGREGR